jgi:activator of HSP90 ATPase
MKKLFKDHLNFETKTNKVPTNEEERMKMNLQNFNVQKIKWKHFGKTGFFVLTITKKLIVKFFK